MNGIPAFSLSLSVVSFLVLHRELCFRRAAIVVVYKFGGAILRYLDTRQAFFSPPSLQPSDCARVQYTLFLRVYKLVAVSQTFRRNTRFFPLSQLRSVKLAV